MLHDILLGMSDIKRINFNVKTDVWRELKMMALLNNYNSLSDMFNSWIASAILRQREKQKENKE